MTLALQLAMVAYFVGLAFCAWRAGREHHADGNHVQSLVDGSFAVLLAGMAALVLARAL